MLWPLDRTGSPLLWEASLLTSLLVHTFLGVVIVLLWPEAGQLSQNVITVEVVTLPRTGGTVPQSVKDSPAPQAAEPAMPAKPVSPPVVVSPPIAQQPKPKSIRQAVVHEQAATSSSAADKPEPASQTSMPAAIVHAQEQPTAPQIDRQAAKASAGFSSSSEPLPMSSDLESVRATYLLSIGSLIDRQKSYPLMARKGRQQGVVQMVFTLDRDGLLDSCMVKESSGFRQLDQAAIRAIRGVQRFPGPPEALGEKPSFQIAISFRLDD